MKTIEKSKTNGSALPELIIDNFDEEQIWQELELQNNDNIHKFESDVSWISSKKDKLLFPVRLKEVSDIGKTEDKKVSKETNMEVDNFSNDDNDDEFAEEDGYNNDLDSYGENNNFSSDDESLDEDKLLNQHKKGKYSLDF